MTAWSVALSFLGALIGSGVAAWAAVRTASGNSRAEWSRRLTEAITCLAGNAEQREIGKELLAALVESNLGSAADRELARRLSRIAALGAVEDAQHEASLPPTPTVRVTGMPVVEDTENHERSNPEGSGRDEPTRRYDD